MKDVVRTQLEQFAKLAKSVTVDGPSMYLKPSAVQQISLALHELAANANANGSSKPCITWQQHEDVMNKDNSTFSLRWEETMPEGVTEPTHKGFGHVVLNYSVPTALNGLSDLSFKDQNVQYHLECPMSSLTL